MRKDIHITHKLLNIRYFMVSTINSILEDANTRGVGGVGIVPSSWEAHERDQGCRYCGAVKDGTKEPRSVAWPSCPRGRSESNTSSISRIQHQGRHIKMRMTS